MKKIKHYFKWMLTAFTLLVVPLTSIGQTVDEQYLDGAVFFKIKDDAFMKIKVNDDNTVNLNQFDFLSEISEKYAIKSVERPYNINGNQKLLRIFLLHFSDIKKIDELIKDLQRNNTIEYAEKCNRQYSFWTTPNDPFYTSTSSGWNWNWYHDIINSEGAWALQKGSNTVKVGIVDNAIWGAHPDLQIPSNHQYNGVNQTTGNSAPPTSVSQTGTYPSLPYQWSHGTHCAGNIAAINNNSVGIASLAGGDGSQASGVQLYAARNSNDNLQAYNNYTNYGVQWLVNQGCKVISLSLGGFVSSQTDQTFYQAVYDAGVTVVVAAGNNADGSQDPNPSNQNGITYPAGYSSTISVAAVNEDGKLAYFSEYGSWIDIAAPGGFMTGGQNAGMSILSTTYCQNMFYNYIAGLYGVSNPLSGMNYDLSQGTSMACPIAASLCALMLSKNPNLTPAQIKSCLQSTDHALTSGSNPISSGNGYIDAQAAIACVQSPSSNVTAMFTPSTSSGNAPLTVQFTNTSSGTPSPNSFTWAWADGTANTIVTTTATQSHTFTNTGTYTVTLTASNGTNSNTHTAVITVNSVSTGTNGCDTISHFSGNAVIYRPTAGGYLLGTNGNGFTDIGEYYAPSELTGYSKIDKAIFVLAKASGSSGNIIFSVLNSTGTSTLGSKSVPLSTIISAYAGQPGNIYTVDFNPDITIPNGQGIIIATSVPLGNGDTLAVLSSIHASSPNGTAWEKYSGSWATVQSDYAGGAIVSATIFPIVCSGTVSDDEILNNQNIQIYPNPSNGDINISFGTTTLGSSTIKVYNNLGVLVSEKAVDDSNNKTTTLILNNIESGIYYVSIINNNQNITKKISIVK